VLVYLALQPTPAQRAGLRNGLYARGQVELGRLTAPALPLSAVHVDQARPYVLALQAAPDGSARVVRRVVELGARGSDRADVGLAAEDWVEIRAGLAPGARVLRGSVGQVADGSPARVPAAPPAASR
ncbi:MAG: hypothetical protein RLZZ584_1192, partial [Pseudomonadota bacterium]